MTQEELDALMSGDVDFDEMEDDAEESQEESEEAEVKEVHQTSSSRSNTHNTPPPLTDENKMVDQLDVVTRESEEKATEIFDILDSVSAALDENASRAESIKEVIESNIALFTTLSKKFPNVSSFKEQLEKNSEIVDTVDEIHNSSQDANDEIMSAMDVMQYQDIHRQKIERVINVIRSLSGYLNLLFSAQKDDTTRTSSAQHLPGDDTNDVVSPDDIEAMLATFGSNRDSAE
jgi:chemotaxis regulatin CheY-phosphate phosphatase CheZ